MLNEYQCMSWFDDYNVTKLLFELTESYWLS